MIGEIWAALDSVERLYVIIIACFIPVIILGIYSQFKVSSTFKKYSQVLSGSGLTGADAARLMLERAGFSHVQISRTSGKLTDHYDPRTDTIYLSDAVYHSHSVAAAGVACHEAGHAVQHNENFVFAKVRSFIVPVVNFSSRIFFPILLIGMVLGFLMADPFIGNVIVYIALVIFGMSTLFTLITLPTEFDASRRAMNFINSGNEFSREEAKKSRKVLTAAAMTYVAAFLMSLLQLLRIVAIILMNTRRKR